jgi:phage terminase large subunit-like protein
MAGDASQKEGGRSLKTIIGVDPPVSLGMCGIIVACAEEGRIRVLSDRSVEGMEPAGWARCVAEAAEEFDADIAIASLLGGGRGEMALALVARATNRPKKLILPKRTFPDRFQSLLWLYDAGRIEHAAPMSALSEEIAVCKERPYGQTRDRLDALLVAIEELTAAPMAERRFA